MKILHLIADYLYSPFYKNFIYNLNNLDVDTSVYVSTRKDVKNTEDYDVSVFITQKHFNWVDKLLYFPKQRYIYKEVVENNLVADINLIHAHTLFSNGFLAYKLYKSYGIPYIVAIRNTDVNDFFKYMFHLRGLGQEIMLNAKNVIFLSPSYMSHVCNKYIDPKYRNIILKKSIVIPNGIDPIFFEKKSRQNFKKLNKTIKLLFVGNIDKNKNVLSVLLAADKLIKEGFEVEVYVVGKLVSKKVGFELKKRNFVRLYSYMKHEGIIDLMHKTDILIVPSFKETFGLVYAEAMSQGMPIIYTKGQGFDGQFEDKYVGCSVVADDIDDICDSIKYIMNNYNEISENCYNSVDKFSWDIIAKKYLELYKI